MSDEKEKDIREQEEQPEEVLEDKGGSGPSGGESKVVKGKTDPADAGKTNKGETAEGKTLERNSEKTGAGKRTFSARPSRKEEEEDDGIFEQVVKINRVAKVVKGGKNFSFSAMVVAGDVSGHYGLGFGKSNEVVGAIKKGSGKARKSFKKVNLKGDTIPHEVIGRYKSSRVLLKPAVRGTGVIAGGPVRALCDAIGIKDILTKSLGSRNAINVVKAAADGFDKLRLKRKG